MQHLPDDHSLQFLAEMEGNIVLKRWIVLYIWGLPLPGHINVMQRFNQEVAAWVHGIEC